MSDLIFIELGGAVITLLLAVIAFFLNRLIGQFDKLNDTMVKMDKDISGKIGVIEVHVLCLCLKEIEPASTEASKADAAAEETAPKAADDAASAAAASSPTAGICK